VLFAAAEQGCSRGQTRAGGGWRPNNTLLTGHLCLQPSRTSFLPAAHLTCCTATVLRCRSASAASARLASSTPTASSSSRAPCSSLDPVPVVPAASAGACRGGSSSGCALMRWRTFCAQQFRRVRPPQRSVQCESRSGVAAISRFKMVKSAWAGDVRWVCSRGGWTGTPPHPPPPGSQAACASCRFPALDGRFERHSTPLHGVHSTTEGHLGVYLLL
jgi:hypothetical protein